MPDDRDISRHDETPAAIPDLGGLPLETILGTDSSPLTNAVRRRLQDLNNPRPTFAAHGTTPTPTQ